MLPFQLAKIVGLWQNFSFLTTSWASEAGDIVVFRHATFKCPSYSVKSRHMLTPPDVLSPKMRTGVSPDPVFREADSSGVRGRRKGKWCFRRGGSKVNTSRASAWSSQRNEIERTNEEC